MVCNRRTREDVDEETRRECEEEEGGGGGKSGGYGSSTMQSYLKEVVDHLTLRLSDIEFVLDVVVTGCDTATTASSSSSVVCLSLHIAQRFPFTMNLFMRLTARPAMIPEITSPMCFDLAWRKNHIDSVGLCHVLDPLQEHRCEDLDVVQRSPL